MNDIFVGELKGRLDAVDKYLDNLNERVATHSEDISDVKQKFVGLETKIAMWAGGAGILITVGVDFIKTKLGL
jgi:ABC-type Fe3+-hydroxamate transport system substrate-binding protein